MNFTARTLGLTASMFFVIASGATHDDLVRQVESHAVKSGATENKAPAWARGGFVYRLTLPDKGDMLPALEEGLLLTSNMLDRSVTQIPFAAGLIGHDHQGPWNWDGLWPYWNRVTYRVGNWESLSGFMTRAKERANTLVSFHLNITDVNLGLADYPESAAFFAKLVETKSIYRRDWNSETNKRDLEPPYIPDKIADADSKDPVHIFALVNYKQFWDSGLARQMIDEFYKHLPYAPPLLYLDVLNASGGNFSPGLPDGPLGGSYETQLEGMRAICDYLHSKGTDIATEGSRPELEHRAGYAWLHADGTSRSDYSVIEGGYKNAVNGLAWQHVAGNSGAFHISPVAITTQGLSVVKEHHAALSAGKPASMRMPGPETFHVTIAHGDNIGREYDIPGTSDPFRGDWSHLINNFYLTTIQELHHIGKGSVRVANFRSVGELHLSQITVAGADGSETVIPIADAMLTHYGQERADRARKQGTFMLEEPMVVRFIAPKAGIYRIGCAGNPHRSGGALNLYVDRALHDTAFGVKLDAPHVFKELELTAGEHEIAIDTGPMYARWSDGTTALWATPYLRTGLRIANGEVVYADDYDRMWPDTWSGQKKIYFFSWDGTKRTWKLPSEFASLAKVTLYPLTVAGRGAPVRLDVTEGSVSPTLLPQVPYVLIVE